MENFIVVTAGAIIFVLLVLVLSIALMNQFNEMSNNQVTRKHESRVYILEVDTKGGITIKEKNVGGGFDYRKF